MPTEPFEDELGTALRRTADTFEPDQRTTLIDGGVRKGRRRLFRRRALAVTGAAAALAVVGLGTNQLTGGTGDTVEQGSVADRAPAKPTPTSKGEFAGADGKPGGISLDSAEIIAALKANLPEGKIVEESGSPTSARVVFDDGKGAASITVGLGRIDPKGARARDLVTCPSKALVRQDDCSSEQLPDGSLSYLFRGYTAYGEPTQTRDWRAVLVTSEGYLIDMTANNAPEEKGVPATRENPPLSTAQLQAIVAAPEWRGLLADTTPAPKETETEDVEAAARLSATFAKLLPKGSIVPDSGFGQEGYASYVLDDGKGASFVGINVQPGFVNENYPLSQAKAEIFTSPETLPDGTLVQESQGPGEKGGEGVVEWKVNALRPNGDRVVIAAYNSGAQHDRATRETPLLTMKQLRDIAVSDKWNAFG